MRETLEMESRVWRFNQSRVNCITKEVGRLGVQKPRTCTQPSLFIVELKKKKLSPSHLPAFPRNASYAIRRSRDINHRVGWQQQQERAPAVP